MAFCAGVDELNVTLYLLSQRSQISPECNMLLLAQPRGSYCVDESLIKRSCGIGATSQEFNLNTPSGVYIFVHIFSYVATQVETVKTTSISIQMRVLNYYVENKALFET